MNMLWYVSTQTSEVSVGNLTEVELRPTAEVDGEGSGSMIVPLPAAVTINH